MVATAPAPSRAARAAALARGRERAGAAVRRLRELVAIPSVSSERARADDVRRCARELAGTLRRIGLDEVALDGERHPIVTAAWRRAGGRPTVLVYGHYDVQPAGPREAWRLPPFAGVLQGGRLHGRGASDDKGQLLCHVAALDAWLGAAGRLPVNVVCLFEGAEEIGSPGLGRWLRRRTVRCDAVVVSDMRMLGPGRPAITTGLRGSLAFELTLRTGSRPLHSGHFGGAVLPASDALAQLVASLHDAGGRIAVAGLTRGVRVPTPAERARLAQGAPGDEQLLREAGVRRGWGDERYTLHERTTIRPAIVVTDLQARAGAHAAIPVRARARINVRLAPDQDPAQAEGALRRHLARHAPGGADVLLSRLSSARPVLIDPCEPAIRAAARACRLAMGRPPALVRSGGTIRAVDLLHRELDAPVVMLGFALPDDRPHAPNESFALSSLRAGTDTAIHLLAELGRQGMPGAGSSLPISSGGSGPSPS